MPQTLSLSDSRLNWAGAASVAHDAGWAMPWRVDHTQRQLLHEGLVERAAMPAGVRLTFCSDTTSIAGRATTTGDEPLLELCCDGALVASISLRDTDVFQLDGLPDGEKVLELWLPQYGEFRLLELQLDDGASFTAYEDNRPRWVTYGSSITQCRTAASPTQTWPAIVARKHNLNLTCLGFGGQCHLDSMIARQIRDTSADFISICVGINIYGNGSLNPRSFGPSILGFVQIIREKHSTTPLVLMSPIFSPEREEVVNSAGFTLREMRREVEKAVKTLQAMGDQNVTYINGLDIFGTDLGHLLPDALHPNAEGYQLMGQRFGDLVAAHSFRPATNVQK